MVKVKFFATLREITGTKEEYIEGNTIEDILEILYRKYGERFKMELEERRMILINGKNIDHLNGIKTKVKSKDVISIFPPAGGG